jgi:hypothetical protein
LLIAFVNCADRCIGSCVNRRLHVFFIALTDFYFIIFLNVRLSVNILIKCVGVKFICNHCKVQSFRICFCQLATQTYPMSTTLPLLLGRLLHRNRVRYDLLCRNTHLLYSDFTTRQQCYFHYYLSTLQPRLAGTGLVQLSLIFRP